MRVIKTWIADHAAHYGDRALDLECWLIESPTLPTPKEASALGVQGTYHYGMLTNGVQTWTFSRHIQPKNTTCKMCNHAT